MSMYPDLSLLIITFSILRVAMAATGCSGLALIHGSADVSSLSSCKTYTGGIVIATDAPSNLDLPGVEIILEELKLFNATELVAFTAKDLKHIGKTIFLQELPLFTTLQLPSLKSVDEIWITGSPLLSTMQFDSPLEDVQMVSIEGTGLSSLDFLNPTNLKSMQVWDNHKLTEISMGVVNVSQYLDIEGYDEAVVKMPSLLNVGNLHVEEVSTFDVPSLVTTKELRLYSNGFSELSMPKLQEVFYLKIEDHKNLESISMDQLKTVRGFVEIRNNDALKIIDGLNGLESVGGRFECSGDFRTLSLPNLRTVGGKMVIESSENITSTCANLDSKTGPVVKGDFECNGKKLSSTSGVGSGGTSQASSESSSSGLSIGARAGIGVGIGLGALLLVGLVVLFVIRKRRRSKATLPEVSTEKDASVRDMIEDKNDPVGKDASAKWSNEPWRAELEGSEGPKYELDHSTSQLSGVRDKPAELSEQHGTSELDRKT